MPKAGIRVWNNNDVRRDTTLRKVTLSVLIAAILCVSAAVNAATPPVMPSGFYYPTVRTWTGDSGGTVGNPKQPWSDGGSGGRIYGYLEKRYESDIGTQHVGMDIRMSPSEPIYAICDGVINRMWKQVSNDPTYWALIVKHYLADGTEFLAIYGHCENLSTLPVGSAVKAGQQIGICREDPNWHCHFGINLTGGYSGFGRIPIGADPDDYGWTAPRTWLLSHTPKIGNPIPTNAPHLSVTAVGDRTNAKPGETYTVTYTVTNDGKSTAQSVSLSAPPPNYATVVSSSPSGTLSGAVYVVPLPQLSVGARTTVSVTYRVL
ncbi:MAG: peptidoglycan DD-metalloendopeptidase family protein [Armatimonadota bacterium]|nr:peptidoglycan DD-metalloendopeptidase family protein [Armatimonadota bacterium]